MKHIGIREIRWVVGIVGAGLLLFALYNGWHTHQLNKRFEDGNNLFRLEDYEGAITEYREVFEESTEQDIKVRALRTIGTTYFHQLENYEQSLSAFQELIETFPDSRFQEEAMFKIAYCLGQLGRANEALKWYADLVNRFPKSRSQYLTLAYFNQGATYSHQGEYDKACENYEEASQSTTDRKRKAEIQLRIGGLYNSQGEHDSAIATYTSLLDEYPDSDFIAQAKYGIAQSHFNLEKWNEAINRYNDIIDKHKDSEEAKDVIPNCFYNLGKTYYQLSVKHTEAGETEKGIEPLKQALDWYQKTLDNFPDHYTRVLINQDLIQIWKANYEQKNNETAQLALEVLIKNSLAGVSLVEADLILIGRENYEQRNYQEALRAYQELMKNFLTSVMTSVTLYDIGNTNYYLENYEDARLAFIQFLQIPFPVYVDKAKVRLLIAKSYLLIAKSYIEQQNKDYAQAYLGFDKLTTKEFQAYPDIQAEAMYRAAYCLKELEIDDEAEAIGRYTEFMARFPRDQHVVDTYFDLGDIYAKQKKYDFAVSQYEAALGSTEDSKRRTKIQLAIGRAYSAQGAKYDNESNEAFEYDNKAIKAFEEAVKAAEEAIETANAKHGAQKTKRERDINNAKLDRVNARASIANIYIRRKQWEKVRDVYKDFIEDYGEAGYTVSRTIIEGPIDADFITFCAHGVGNAYYEMNDFRNALEWYLKIVTKKGFKNDDAVPDALKENDLRTDPLTPEVLYSAMRALSKLKRMDELETIATTYIEGLRDAHPILSAGAQLRFAHIKREELGRYNKAATEYAKLQDYPPIPDPKLNLIKLKGKYYEGVCYDKLSRRQDREKNQEAMEKVYQEAITFFNTTFQPLINTSNIDVSDLDKELFDYCIKTAKDYAEKIRGKLKEIEQKSRNKTDEEMDKSDASGNSGSSEKPKTAQEIAKIGRESTVVLVLEYTEGESVPMGTGFFVSPSLIVTNYHVIEGAIRGTARLVGDQKMLSEGKKMSYAILGYTAIDSERDLAILMVRAFGVKPLPLGNREDIHINDEIYAVGNPLGRPYLEGIVSDGKISGIRDIYIHITAPVSPGNSGGPLLNNKGEVIGIAQAQFLDKDDKDDKEKKSSEKYDVKNIDGTKTIGSVELPRRREQNLNLAIHVDVLKELLQQVGPPKPLSDFQLVPEPSERDKRD